MQTKEYWASRPAHFDAMAIYLEDEEWLDEPVTTAGRSYGGSSLGLSI
jgi:hypothetical protein